MNEVKAPKKPLIYYYGIVMLVLMLFNFLAIPWFAQRQILEVDYGIFMEMADRFGTICVSEEDGEGRRPEFHDVRKVQC